MSTIKYLDGFVVQCFLVILILVSVDLSDMSTHIGHACFTGACLIDFCPVGIILH